MKRKASRPAPPVGSVFEHTYKGTLYQLRVIQTDWGTGYEVQGIGVFKSPTAAAKAVVGEQFINGRAFWKIDCKDNGKAKI